MCNRVATEALRCIRYKPVCFFYVCLFERDQDFMLGSGHGHPHNVLKLLRNLVKHGRVTAEGVFFGINAWTDADGKASEVLYRCVNAIAQGGDPLRRRFFDQDDELSSNQHGVGPDDRDFDSKAFAQYSRSVRRRDDRLQKKSPSFPFGLAIIEAGFDIPFLFPSSLRSFATHPDGRVVSI